MRYQKQLLGMMVMLGLVGVANGYAESPKAILHDTGAKLKEATHDIGSVFKHGTHKTKSQIKTGTVTKPVKHWGHKANKNLKKAIGK